MADDLERLTAMIDANDTALMNAFKRMEDGFDKSLSSFNKNANAIEKRQEQLSQRLASGVANLTKGLLAGVFLVGIERFVESTTEMASGLKSAADTLKVGTDELQAWAIIARRSHVAQADFNADLDTFGKNMGKAAVEGGPLRKLFQGLGVDIHGTVTDGVYKFADAIQKTKDPQQQIALVTAAWGKSAANLTPVLAQGGAALRAQVDQLRQAGYIIDQEGIRKLDDLGNSWDDLKRKLTVAGAGVLTGFLDQFSTFAGEIGSPEFKANMEAFGSKLAEIVGLLVKLGPYLPQIAGGGVGAKVGGLIGSIWGPSGRAAGTILGAGVGAGAVDFYQNAQPYHVVSSDPDPGQVGRYKWAVQHRDFLQKMIKEGKASVADEQDLAETLDLIKGLETKNSDVIEFLKKKPPAGGTQDHSDLLNTQVTAQKKYLSDLAYQIAQQRRQVEQQSSTQVRSATLQSDEAQRSAHLDQNEAQRDAVRAQDNALLEMSRGVSDYYELQRKIIAELARLDIESVNDRRDAELSALKERTDADIAAAQERQVNATAAIEDRRKKQVSDLQQQELSAAQVAKTTKQINDAAADEAARTAQASQQEQTQLLAGAEAQRQSIIQSSAYRTSAILAKQKADIHGSLEDQYQTQADMIAVSDAARNGVIDVGTAIVTNLDNAGDAVKSLIMQLIQMGLQMELLKPLAQYLFGSQGTAGGGLLGGVFSAAPGADRAGAIGDFLSSLWPFKLGGVMTAQGAKPLRRYSKGGVASSPQYAEFGEGSTNEAFIPLPDGRRVPVKGQFNLDMPDMSQVARQVQNNNTFRIGIDLTGANGDDAIARAAHQAAKAGAEMAISHVSRNFNSIQADAQDRFG